MAIFRLFFSGVGSVVSGGLLVADIAILRRLDRLGINGARHAQATHMYREEALRCYIQLGNFILGLQVIVLDPERYSPLINALWLTTLVSTLFNLSVAILLMGGSISTERLRRKLTDTRPGEGIQDAASN